MATRAAAKAVRFSWQRTPVFASSPAANNGTSLFSSTAARRSLSIPAIRQQRPVRSSLQKVLPFSTYQVVIERTKKNAIFFSSPFALARSFSSSQDLYRMLTREHAEEVENETTVMPSELVTLKNTLEADWKIVDDGAMTKMYRNIGGGPVKVQIGFHCQDTVEIEDVESDYIEEEVEEPAGPARFTVTATKAGNTLCMTCLSEDATARIESIALTTEDVESVHSKSGVGRNQYQGPVFGELAEDVQDALLTYLEDDIGVTQDVASFVSMYSDYREQQEYVKFLEGAMDILNE